MQQETRSLAERLTVEIGEARAALAADPRAFKEPCDTAGGVRATIYREAGAPVSAEVWTALRRATEGLIAACGQQRLLTFPAGEGEVVERARAAWAAGAARELELVCDHLAVAARELGRPTTGC